VATFGLTCATADPNCCHLGCTAQAPWATKLPAPSQARAVGPAELTARLSTGLGRVGTNKVDEAAIRNELLSELGMSAKDPCQVSVKLRRLTQGEEIEMFTRNGVPPNSRCSGPVLLSSWVQIASLRSAAPKTPVPSQGSGRTGR
jgi:hypothetical protein